jgi:ribosome-binding protein aMBF1 (putative translation factor)
MDKQTIEHMRKTTEEQAQQIRALPGYDEFKREFNLEYQIASELATARQEAGLTQAQIAAIMGTTQSVVSRIERGANISVETISRYAHACGKRLEVHVR